MKSLILASLVIIALLTVVSADERHTMTGVVLKVDPPARTMLVSTDKVPGFMDAMAMPFSVSPARISGSKRAQPRHRAYVPTPDRAPPAP